MAEYPLNKKGWISRGSTPPAYNFRPCHDFCNRLGTQRRCLQTTMTSLAFVLGVVPLAISTGAGSGSQHAIGTGVIGGMLTATILAIFWVPLFFVTVSSMGQRKNAGKDDAIETPKEAGQ